MMADTVSLRGWTILIADDDRSIRTVLSRALGRLDCDVRTTGTAATSKVREAKLDLFDPSYQIGGN